MHRWFFGFFIFFLTLSYVAVSGAVDIAESALKVATYASFSLALVCLLLGIFAHSKVKATF